MKVHVVTKSPVDLPDTTEFVGAFTTREKADAACIGAGQYTIAEMTLDRLYRGDLFDVRMKIVLDHRQT